MKRLKTKPVHIKARKIGGWAEMDFDAEVIHRGIHWLRVKGGFGGRGEREDWIAVLPEGCISVCDYYWRGPRFGFIRYGSFRLALEGQLKSGVDDLKESLRDHKEAVAKLKKTLTIIERSLGVA